ncbi:MAG: 4'-phosphopantetheinyl transferase superfamily protein [Balneolaceae bacterium]
MPERLTHPDLPEDIVAAYGLLKPKKISGTPDVVENITGSRFVKKMSDRYMGITDLDIHTQKYEKPKAFIKEEEISVSFSHTSDAISAAVSRYLVVGCDMEMTGREVHPRLASRMRHPGEKESLYQNLEHIQIWTFKEAALKCIGTGLRKPMKSVKIDQRENSLFDVEFDGGRIAKICSFRHKEHWISICYHNKPLH